MIYLKFTLAPFTPLIKSKESFVSWVITNPSVLGAIAENTAAITISKIAVKNPNLYGLTKGVIFLTLC